MFPTIRSAASLLALFTLLTGVAYPLAITAVVQLVVPEKANGSLVRVGDAVVGSRLIGQNFASEGYFRPRPSAAGPNGYDAAASSGSNLGPLSVKLNERIASSLAALKTEDPAAVPADAVTASGSGLDPHISIAYAERQIARVARARKVEPARVQGVLDKVAERPFGGIVGEPRVNVLMLNIALDAEIGKSNG
ncbi:MAG: potassium-transporting ATPase subunit KdpC [Hyphomicrobium sp.]